MNKKNRLLVMCFSIVPGGGHLYLGELKKAATLFFVFLLITTTFFTAPSLLVKVLMGFVYLALVIPSMVEAYVWAKGASDKSVFSKSYIIFMLFTTGMSAFPLLWTSDEFSKRAKIIWSVVVILLACFFFAFLASYWAELEALLNQYFASFLS